jgi:putative transposase
MSRNDPRIEALTENAVVACHDEQGTSIVRLLAIDRQRQACAFIAVANPKALPFWVSLTALDQRLRDGLWVRRAEDEWYADTRPDEELTPAMRRTRDTRYAVIAPIVTPMPGELQSCLDASTRHQRVLAANEATGRAVDKIYAWLQLYWQGGQVPNALLPKYARCGRRGDGQAPKIGSKKRGRPSKLAQAGAGHEGMNVTAATRALLVRGGRRFWRKRTGKQQLTLRQAYQRTLETFFVKRVEYRNNQLVPVIWEDESDNARLPTFRQFSYWLGKDRNTRQDLVSRAGERAYNLRHRPVLSSSAHLSHGPGDLYLIDATVADVYLVSSINRAWVIGRPVLYLVIDHFSRMIVGLAVGLEGPSWVGAMMALENALCDKVSFCQQYGIEITEDEWPCHYVPRQITGDRGEMISKASDALVAAFGITVSNTPPFRADFKAFVEGQFKITNEKGIVRLPGYVERMHERGDTDYRLDSKLDIHDFTKLIISLALHNNTRRRLVDQVPVGFDMPADMDPRPLDLWEWGVEHRLGQMREFPRERVRVNLLHTVKATATRRGFKTHGGLLYYDSATAREQGWFTGATGRRAVTVTLSYDARDVSRVFLRHENGQRIEECPLADHNAHFAGKTLDEVRDQRDRLVIGRQRGFGQERQDEAELSARLDAIVNDAVERAAPQVDVRDIRGNRRAEQRKMRRDQAFSADATSTEPPASATPRHHTADPAPSPGVEPHPGAPHEYKYIPFPS